MILELKHLNTLDGIHYLIFRDGIVVRVFNNEDDANASLNRMETDMCVLTNIKSIEL